MIIDGIRVISPVGLQESNFPLICTSSNIGGKLEDSYLGKNSCQCACVCLSRRILIRFSHYHTF